MEAIQHGLDRSVETCTETRAFGDRPSKPYRRIGALSVLASMLSVSAFADDDIFNIVALNTEGRIVSAHFGDFNGDGRKDLFAAALRGLPPAEARHIHVFLQSSDGSFPTTPSHSLPIPQWSAVYDVADLNDTPGEELAVLRPDGVTILSVGDASGERWDFEVAGPNTVGVGDDERGFEPFRLVVDDLDDEPWLLVPQIGAVSVLSADGTEQALLDVGRRANYYITETTGLVSVESEIQLFLDVPKLSVGDVDGDGQNDITAATRHEIRVFLRQPDGRFEREASFAVPLTFISEEDHARGTGSIVSTVRDIDNDGRVDLMVSHVEGSFTDTVTTTYLYRNHDGRWDLAQPDDTFVSDGTLSSDLLFDVDDDNELELLRIQFRFSVLEIVEFLLTRKFDLRIVVHKLQEDGRYSRKPWAEKKMSTAISFDTFRPKGFLPQGGLDLNGDGFTDFVTSADGRGIEIYLGSEDGPFSRRSVEQKLDSAGKIAFDDIDGDGLPDFVLYNPAEADAPVRIGRNAGTL